MLAFINSNTLGVGIEHIMGKGEWMFFMSTFFTILALVGLIATVVFLLKGFYQLIKRRSIQSSTRGFLLSSTIAFISLGIAMTGPPDNLTLLEGLSSGVTMICLVYGVYFIANIIRCFIKKESKKKYVLSLVACFFVLCGASVFAPKNPPPQRATTITQEVSQRSEVNSEQERSAVEKKSPSLMERLANFKNNLFASFNSKKKAQEANDSSDKKTEEETSKEDSSSNVSSAPDNSAQLEQAKPEIQKWGKQVCRLNADVVEQWEYWWPQAQGFSINNYKAVQTLNINVGQYHRDLISGFSSKIPESAPEETKEKMQYVLDELDRSMSITEDLTAKFAEIISEGKPMREGQKRLINVMKDGMNEHRSNAMAKLEEIYSDIGEPMPDVSD